MNSIETKVASEPVLSALRSLHEAMVRTRVVDGFLAELAATGLIGMHAPARGLEGPMHGSLAALTPSDWVLADVRMSSAALVRGLDLQGYLAQALGGVGSANAGHAAPGELTWKAGRVVSTSSLMGTHLMHAAGIAQAMKAKRDPSCVVALFGPAAAATGDAHCAWNFAGVYQLPVVYVFCSSGDDGERLAGDFADKGDGYGLPVLQADGAEVLDVRDTVAEAAERARSGGGATLVSVSAGDALTGVEADLTWRGADAAGWRRTLESRFEAELKEALEAVKTAGPPALATLFDDVYAQPDARLQQQHRDLANHIARFGGGAID